MYNSEAFGVYQNANKFATPQDKKVAMRLFHRLTRSRKKVENVFIPVSFIPGLHRRLLHLQTQTTPAETEGGGQVNNRGGSENKTANVHVVWKCESLPQ